MQAQLNCTRRQVLKDISLIVLAPAASAASAAAAADGKFPLRPIRIIVPFAPGASTDFLARVIADRLALQMEQPVTVENRPGAGGIMGTQQLARSASDGYTIGICSLATLAMVPTTLKDAPYDSVRDFAPLSAVASNDMVLATTPHIPATTLREFVAWASAQQSAAFLGTQGAGTSGHFAGFMFGKAAKIRFEPVHYKNVGELITGVMAGDVHAYFGAPSTVLSHVSSGKLRLLATNGSSRLPGHPNVPTFGEAGFPDMQYLNWVGLAAPSKTPPEVLAKLSAEILKALSVPQVRARLEEGGFRVIGSRPEELSNLIRNDVAFWTDIVKTTGFKV
ncbi:Bug family tripartite tricarboxylate transporter substrate binding protein [Variovorax saccharolyticus]|uniref:Bug family tripartite tricarboxylate transporter substrate binding protein n=1 Tax=Variovorax saccharolyticus TaxID=3053516 RepID=UPI0025750252|nr:tripartite tricarboxylate transporter substrate binding protein [Variovorax sp. J22R187]MDM0022202.1 tripartite tricarboxylate transporter substrate binding protein [Variovorax sp. J22R187]